MGRKNFEEYLESQKDTNKNDINWDLKKEEWIEEVNSFLKQIGNYFTNYKDNVVINEQSFTINEEYLGSYEIKKLILNFNSDTVIFTPVGRNIIGARGRIDMEGKAGKVKFVLVGEETQSPNIISSIITSKQEQEEHEKSLIKTTNKEKNIWKIATPPPKIKYLELNEDSFFDALMEVING